MSRTPDSRVGNHNPRHADARALARRHETSGRALGWRREHWLGCRSWRGKQLVADVRSEAGAFARLEAALASYAVRPVQAPSRAAGAFRAGGAYGTGTATRTLEAGGRLR